MSGFTFLPKCCFFSEVMKKTRRAEKNVFLSAVLHRITLHYITFYAFLLCYFVKGGIFFNIYVVCELCNVM